MGFLDALGKIGNAVAGFTPIGMVAQAAGGLIGSAMDNHANKKIAQMNYDAQMATNEANKEMNDATNAANLQIARENNAFNRESAQMQNEWNMQQWQRENQYNSPEAMASRLLAAGINPANAGIDGVSPAGSIQSADVAPASDVGKQEAARFQAPRFDYTQSTWTNALQNAALLGNMKGQNYDYNERKATFSERMNQLQAMTEKLRQEGKLTKFQASMADTLDQLKKLTLNDEVAKVHQDLLLSTEQTKNIIADTANKEAETDFLKFQKDYQIPKELELRREEIDAALKSAALSYRGALAAAAASRYGSDMSYKAAHEATEAAKEKASNDFVAQMRNAGIGERNVRVAEQQFKLMLNHEEFDRSATKFVRDLAKGAVGAVLPAVGGFQLGKSSQAAKTGYYSAPSFSY